MRNSVMFLLVALFMSSQMFGQEEVVYGTVRTDGYQKITKGAFWSTRPEAKMVYNGGTPPGVTVYTLESDYFVRFKDGQHNQNDKNYIVFPKGEKVYSKGSQFFSAICGNEIEYLAPVERVKIISSVNYIEKSNKKTDTVIEKTVYVKEVEYVETRGYNPQFQQLQQQNYSNFSFGIRIGGGGNNYRPQPQQQRIIRYYSPQPVHYSQQRGSMSGGRNSQQGSMSNGRGSMSGGRSSSYGGGNSGGGGGGGRGN